MAGPKFLTDDGESLCPPARPLWPGLPGPQHGAPRSKGTSAALWALPAPSMDAFPDLELRQVLGL